MSITDARMIKCATCGREYNSLRLKKCPACAVSNQASTVVAEDVPRAQPQIQHQIPEEEDPIYEFLQELINAQNRTTHAVRALVRFFFIQLSALTIAGFFYSLANNSVNAYACTTQGTSCNPNGFFIFLAVAIWIVGIFISSSIGWKELSGSNIPGEHSGNSYSY